MHGGKMTQTIFDTLKREVDQNFSLGCIYIVNIDIYVVFFLLNGYI